MGVTMRSELSQDLTPTQADRNFDFLHQASGAAAPTITLSSDIATVTGTGFYMIDTQGGAGSDNCTRVNGTVNGDIVQFRSVSAARDVTFVHGANLKLANGTAFTLNEIYDLITFRSYGGDILVEISRSSNST